MRYSGGSRPSAGEQDNSNVSNVSVQAPMSFRVDTELCEWCYTSQSAALYWPLQCGSLLATAAVGLASYSLGQCGPGTEGKVRTPI